MKAYPRGFKFKPAIVISICFMTYLSLSGCNNGHDSTQNLEDSNSQILQESDAVLPSVVVPATKAPVSKLPSTEASLAEVSSNEISSTADKSKSGYIAPEMLVEKLNNPVNDFTSTLSATELDFLNEKLSKIYEEGLLQIGVAIVDTTGEMPIFDYAMAVASKWALGSPENSNGISILVALDDKKIYILTGVDVEDELTDERVAKIINDDIMPHFGKANYVTGLSAGIDALVWDMRQYS